MNAKRLLRLADELDEQPRKLFYMNVWFEERSCGTVCCAGGLACTIPSFKRAGLKRETQEPFMGGKPVPTNGVEYTDEHGIVYRSFDALAKFFDIPEDHATKLFSGGHPYPSIKPTPKQVARALRQYVKSGGVIA